MLSIYKQLINKFWCKFARLETKLINALQGNKIIEIFFFSLNDYMYLASRQKYESNKECHQIEIFK